MALGHFFNNENIWEKKTAEQMFIESKILEEAIADLLCNKFEYESYQLIPGRFSPYDFEINKGSKSLTVECKKQEKKWAFNIYIEIESLNTGKPSGLSVTTADRWVEYLERYNELLITKPEVIKNLIAAHPELKRVNGGQGTKGVLIPISLFKKEIKPLLILSVSPNFGNN